MEPLGAEREIPVQLVLQLTFLGENEYNPATFLVQRKLNRTHGQVKEADHEQAKNSHLVIRMGTQLAM